LCAKLGMNVNISCKTGESSIAYAAALHAAYVLPEIAWALTLTHTGLAEDISTAPIPTANGHVQVLERPGLGVDVDENRVRRRCRNRGAKSRIVEVPKGSPDVSVRPQQQSGCRLFSLSSTEKLCR
jgi:hypothetical protein